VPYFDNAATTFPKPESVYEAMTGFMRTAAGNPGRGAHRLALCASEIIDESRLRVARFFGASSPSRVLFCSNCTAALNMVLHGLLEPGDHVVTSSMEHNAIIRPLHTLAQKGIEVTRVECASDGSWTVDDVMAAMRPKTRLVAVGHASNVTGTIQPIEELGLQVRSRDSLLLVDAAQTAGILPLDMESMSIDFLAFPGHKELLGPPGTGGLVAGKRAKLRPTQQGGTGTRSEEEWQPDDMPEGFETGTINSVGIAGLNAGLSFITKTGLDVIRAHQLTLIHRLLQGLATVPGLSLYGPAQADRQVGVVSINLSNWEPMDLGIALDQDFDIAVRTGLHCAPLAHRTIGTYPTGTVRFSPGHFTTLEDIDLAIDALHHLAGQWRRGVPQVGVADRTI